jgi:multicomponent Na+:H+ antiporter subunit F
VSQEIILIIAKIVLAIIGVAVTLSVYTLIKAALAVEKMVALDVITTITTAGLLLLSLILKDSFILDIALIYAVLSFGAVMVVARYREREI